MLASSPQDAGAPVPSRWYLPCLRRAADQRCYHPRRHSFHPL